MYRQGQEYRKLIMDSKHIILHDPQIEAIYNTISNKTITEQNNEKILSSIIQSPNILDEQIEKISSDYDVHDDLLAYLKQNINEDNYQQIIYILYRQVYDYNINILEKFDIKMIYGRSVADDYQYAKYFLLIYTPSKHLGILKHIVDRVNEQLKKLDEEDDQEITNFC